MKLSTITASLAQLGMQPTKSLGQNFLHDQNLADWIVAQLDIKPEKRGWNSAPASARSRNLPRSFAERPRHRKRRPPRRLPARTLSRARNHPRRRQRIRRARPLRRGPVKVLGNLPYYVSSQILFGFTSEPSPVSALIFTLQKELAERLSAKPRTKAYGALTLLVGRRWHVKYCAPCRRASFCPHPTSNPRSSCSPRVLPAKCRPCDGDRFTRLVKQGFAQRRKQLRKNLADHQFDCPPFAPISASKKPPAPKSFPSNNGSQ